MNFVTTLDGKQFTPELPKRLLLIAEDIRSAGGRAFLVGGWVRDALLGKNCRDYDVEVYDLEQDQLLSILKNYGRPNLVGKAFGVIHLAMHGEDLDFSFPRTESKVGYGHRGFVVKTDAKLSFKQAAYRRDFTINAMGMELPELTLCDPYGGIDDLKSRTLRHVGEAFGEDSLRILRGVQFASRFHLTLHQDTAGVCRQLSLEDLSSERLLEEFKKWLLKPGKPSMGLKAFLQMGLDEYFPEVGPMEESWEKLGQLLDKVNEVVSGSTELNDDQKQILAFASLLMGCPKKALVFLNRITNEIKVLRGVPELLSCLESLTFSVVPSDAEMRRLGVRSEKFLGGLQLLHLLLSTFWHKDDADAFKVSACRLGVYLKSPESYLTGKMLMDLGLKPGKEFGQLIKENFELQLDGKICSAEEALAWAQNAISSGKGR
ncbi:MAG: CCA tRNA nucleotidyltransferase [Fibrobacteraceae bacterium]|nr:CCA tRNA nucleotidyltransferase [Fibrobacteraceae bacterium]